MAQVSVQVPDRPIRGVRLQLLCVRHLRHRRPSCLAGPGNYRFYPRFRSTNRSLCNMLRLQHPLRLLLQRYMPAAVRSSNAAAGANRDTHTVPPPHAEAHAYEEKRENAVCSERCRDCFVRHLRVKRVLDAAVNLLLFPEHPGAEGISGGIEAPMLHALTRSRTRGHTVVQDRPSP